MITKELRIDKYNKFFLGKLYKAEKKGVRFGLV